MTELTALLGVDNPLIQAPMAGVQGSRLAIAVSNAGGVGSLPGAMLSPARLREELHALRAGTSRPYNVNFFCHATPVFDAQHDADWRAALAPYYRELALDPDAPAPASARVPFDGDTAELLAEFQPPILSFHFGLPAPQLLQRVRRWGACILASATTLDEALWLEQRGVDAIIAQGSEAGGHRGMFLGGDLATQLDSHRLLAQLVGRVSVPLIAAGAIGGATDVRDALRRGAAGVQVGTAYLLCPESDTSAVHRAALRGITAHETAVTNLFSGRPARGIVNRLMRELGPISAFAPTFPLAANAIAPLRAAAEKRGSCDFSPLWAGSNAAACRDIPAAELTRELCRGFIPTSTADEART